MAENSAINPILEDEVFYRRISQVYYKPPSGIDREAFLPTSADTNGLSLSRGHVGQQKAAESGRCDREFYVGEIRARDFPAGLSIVPDSNDHALIPEMTYAARKSNDKATKDQLRQWAETLRRRCTNIVGPYRGRGPIPETR